MSIYYTIRKRVNRNRAWSRANTNGTRMNRNETRVSTNEALVNTNGTWVNTNWTWVNTNGTRANTNWTRVEHEWNTNEVGVSTNATLTNTNGIRVCNQRLKTSCRLHHLYVQLDRRWFFGLNKNGGQYKHNRITVKDDARPHVFRGVRLYCTSSERFNSEIRLPYMVSLHGNKLLFQTKCIEEPTRQRLSGIIALSKKFQNNSNFSIIWSILHFNFYSLNINLIYILSLFLPNFLLKSLQLL